MSDAIDYASELERKTLEALAVVLNDYEQGAISQPTAAYALRSIFTVTSGLAGGDTFDMISQASALVEADAKRDVQRRFYVHPGEKEVIAITYQFGEAEVGLRRGSLKGGQLRWTRESQATFQEEVNPFEAARHRFEGYADQLKRLGYEEIN
jgi:hypothetical protein